MRICSARMIEVIALMALAGSSPQRSLQCRSASAIGSNRSGPLIAPHHTLNTDILTSTHFREADRARRAGATMSKPEGAPGTDDPTATDDWLAEQYPYETERVGPLRDALRAPGQAPLHAGRSRLLRSRPRPRRGLPGQLSLHARRLPVDAPRAPVDDAPVRRLRHRRRDQRALPLPARARPDRPLDRLRHAHADGPRLRPRPLARRGRRRGRRARLRRRHGDPLRRHPASTR